MTVQKSLYHYRAKVCSVYDADTIRVDIDLGLGVWMRNQSLRLFGIDAPEVRGAEREAGLRSRDFVRNILPQGHDVVVETIRDKTGKYGRWLAHVWYQDKNGGWHQLSAVLVEEELAEERTY